MKILYLYAEVMGYTMATIGALVQRGAKVCIVHWDKKKRTPYIAPEFYGVKMYRRSAMSRTALSTLLVEFSPTIVVVSGWQDRGYLPIVREARSRGVIVVVAFDDQWHGSGRQSIAAFLGHFGVFKRYFSHAWVTGLYQFEYARRLGFRRTEIISDLYSADTNSYQSVYHTSIGVKANRYPHRFLFVGRIEFVKGIDILLNAWNYLKAKRHDWKLCLIGDGSLKGTLDAPSDVVIKDFMQPTELVKEVETAGCFVLPSRSEPWGVVVHEFSAAGLPMIVSDAVGASASFVIHGLNGYLFRGGSHESLASRMGKIMDHSDSELIAMSANSNYLSKRITPETSASNLLSICSLEGK